VGYTKYVTNFEPYSHGDVLMRRILLIIIGLILFSSTVFADSSKSLLSSEEQTWVEAHRDTTFTVGLDPYTGMDYYDFQKHRTGFLPRILEDIRKQLGVNLVVADVSSWNDSYRDFLNGKIDVLYGANPTAEREKIMTFTKPVQRYPYAVFARKDSSIQVLGDLDGKRIGFIEGDYAIDRLPKEYSGIHFQTVEFPSQVQGLKALVEGRIDGFITSGGGIVYDFMYNYPNVTVIAELPTVTSDMTFATLKDKAILARILDKYIETNQKGSIQQIFKAASLEYNRKILHFTSLEMKWLLSKHEAVVGVADDYLPFDYYQNGQYKGIAGATLNTISEITGIRFKVVHGSFASLYNQALQGSVDVLNIAKTDERLKSFIFPRPISTERDIIVGRKDSSPVQDVYGLEGKRIAVIDGFWHEEYLKKNLKKVEIVKTKDIMESLRLLRKGNVDYLIENPTVVEYYINGLGYTDLVKRGDTSKDSFVYFGVSKKDPELASIMDKALSLIRFEDMKYEGIQTVPEIHNEQSEKLRVLVVWLSGLILLLLLGAVKIVRDLIHQRMQTQLLKEREHLLYTDALTGFHNRNYFNHIEKELSEGAFPQTVLVTDLNNLKNVNDTYGHSVGDALLTQFSKVLGVVFWDGRIFRMGGDEFLIILDLGDENEIMDRLDQVRTQCAESLYLLDDNTHLMPSAAIGYCIRKDDSEPLNVAIIHADDHMYRVKSRMKGERRRKEDHDPIKVPN